VVTGPEWFNWYEPDYIARDRQRQTVFETDDVQRCALHGAAQRQP
jgi:hypothetical protein